MRTEANGLVLAGGGLANGLIAWRLRQLRPELPLTVLEAGPTLGGNHTWCFHDGDLDAPQRAWMAPLVAHRWPQHVVMFDQRSRRMASGYNAITSERFHEVLSRDLGSAVRLSTPVAEVRPQQVVTAGGEVIDGQAVIDGRGFAPMTPLDLRYQKFLGLELRLKQPHGLQHPVLMDARVPQLDGYRFVYLLPLSADTLLVEDTYYADTPALAPAALRGRALAYAQTQGWDVAEVLREEQGVLPIAIDGDVDAFWQGHRGQPVSGLRAGLFHPTTGYSLPQAVRLAELIARQPDLSAATLAAVIERHARRVWRSQYFFRALNRMLFLAGPAEGRHQVLSHFYRLPDALVARFYGERLTPIDMLRIVTGKPPVPFFSALKVLLPPRRMESPA